MSMETTGRLVLSFKDKVLTLMCSGGLMFMIAGVFSLCAIPFVEATIWPASLKLGVVGFFTVWLSVILNRARSV